MQVVVSTGVFLLVHSPEGIGTAIAAGLIVGFHLAFTYTHCGIRIG